MPPYSRAYGFQAAGLGLTNLARLLGDRRRDDRAFAADEDERALRERELRAQEMAQPGSRPFEDSVADLTPESARGAATASQPWSPTFRAPPPRETKDPLTGQVIRVQEPAPYMTPRGVVMDPSATSAYSRARAAEEAATASGRSIAMDDWRRKREAFDAGPGIPGVPGMIPAIPSAAGRRRASEIGRLVRGGIDPKAAELIVSGTGDVNSALLQREAHPEMYRTDWESGSSAATTRTRPTINQALEIVNERYAKWGTDANGKQVFEGYVDERGKPVSFTTRYTEAVALTKGEMPAEAPKSLAPPPSRGNIFLDAAQSMGGTPPARATARPKVGESVAPTPPMSPAQADYDALVAQFGRARVEQELGPRPSR